jgi:hypothetical protein
MELDSILYAMRRTTFLTLLLISSSLLAQRKTENVVLITFDGFRWQELFSGADQRLISKSYVNDSAAIAKKYWRDNADGRRLELLPFFWTVIAKQGQIYGNRNEGSLVNVTNRQWFSYPGYSEILCGFADDERVASNNKVNNPNTTVLEFINQEKAFRGRVVAFSSWDVFPYIINSSRSGIPVNSGIVEAKGKGITEKEKWINELMHQVPNPLGDIRLDAFTYHYALEYMKKSKPRVTYIAFDETDDFAHGGKYDLYLDAAHYTDAFIKSLWEWCQSDPQYKGKTTFIITSDHGRGTTTDDWRHHGIKVPNADQIWLAIMGPDTPASGELKNSGQLYQNQIAKTLAAFLEIDYRNQRPTGDLVKSAFLKY